MSAWHKVASLEEIPILGTRVVVTENGNIAVFRTAENEVFALYDKCPHKGGALSQGIVHGKKVACPMHGWNINLENGEAIAPDVGCARTVESKLQDGHIFLAI